MLTRRSQLPNVDKKIQENINKRRRNKIVGALAVLVAISTIGVLMRTAIALQEETYCGLEEHIHSDECYEIMTLTEIDDDTEVIQTVVDEIEPTPEIVEEEQENKDKTLDKITQEHVHTDECYAVVEHTEQDQQIHVHTDECYAKKSVITCDKEEIEGHSHTDDCYETMRELSCEDDSEEHEHTDECYREEKDLSCDKEETEGHSHTDDCYSEEETLICEESEDTGESSTQERILICGKTETTDEKVEVEPTVEAVKEQGERVLVCEKEAHRHSLQCYSNPEADLETHRDWEATLPASGNYTGDVRHDTLEVAKSQLGYRESEKNYKVVNDDQKKGYTRYGEWYGEPYEDWNAMFAYFCLYYGGAENMPMDKDCASWVEALSDEEVDLYRLAGEYTPESGELVFFDTDKDGTPDWVGIIEEITQDSIVTIQGDVEDRVDRVTYDIYDSTIIGYALLDDTEVIDDDSLNKAREKFSLSAQTESGITVTVSGKQSALPYPAEEITLTANDLENESVQLLVDRELEEQGLQPEISYQVDITLWHDEEIIEPTDTVTVTFSGLDMEDYEIKVYHIESEETCATNIKSERNEDGDTYVDIDRFSTFVITGASFAVDDNEYELHGLVRLTEMNGNYQVTDTAWTYDTIIITGDTILDLNGHALYYKETDNLFIVPDGVKFTIVDHKEESINKSLIDSDTKYGNLAEVTYDEDNDKVELQYYVTESSVSDNVVDTIENLYQYNISTTGIIVGVSDEGCGPLVKIEEGAEFTLESGLLTVLHGDNYDRSPHILYNQGTLNITGGYICGGKNATYGGGVYTTGTMNMCGGVIAANSGTKGGGVHVANGTFNLSGGVISGNQVFYRGSYTGGAGIYINSDGTLNLSGDAYVTNNSYNAECGNDDITDSCHGGGAIASFQGAVTITGGFVTGNYSSEAGGGMYIGYNDNGTSFYMTNGIVASNYSANAEGGGIAISGGTNATIRALEENKVYITHNRTNTSSDTGGGGIFVQQDSTLNVYSSLITSNTVQGNGGGIAAYPTGIIWVVSNEGTAIYDNSAIGTDNQYRDYYCVNTKSDKTEIITMVMREMLGGESANWTGTCDNSDVVIEETGYQIAKLLCGLTANPSEEARQKAVESAKVFIMGNSSSTNGGGIMAKGNLILGNNNNIGTLSPRLVVKGKMYLDTDMSDEVLDSIQMEQFKFVLLNDAPILDDSNKWIYSEESVIGSATATVDDVDKCIGNFTINTDKKVEYDSAGIYTYYLLEDTGSEANIVYDKTLYTINVEIRKYTAALNDSFDVFVVDDVEVVESNIVQDEEQNSAIYNTRYSDGYYTVRFNTVTFNNAFMNTYLAPVYIGLKIYKTDDIEMGLDGAIFKLYNYKEDTVGDEIGSGKSINGGEVEFRDANNKVVQLQRNTAYYLEEVTPPNGYVQKGPWIVEVKDDATATLYQVGDEEDSIQARTTDDGSEIISESEGTQIKITVNIPNDEQGYQLPSTGGIGTTQQLTIGEMFLVVCVGLLLWYRFTKRGKEDIA